MSGSLRKDWAIWILLVALGEGLRFLCIHQAKIIRSGWRLIARPPRRLPEPGKQTSWASTSFLVHARSPAGSRFSNSRQEGPAVQQKIAAVQAEHIHQAADGGGYPLRCGPKPMARPETTENAVEHFFIAKALGDVVDVKLHAVTSFFEQHEL